MDDGTSLNYGIYSKRVAPMSLISLDRRNDRVDDGVDVGLPFTRYVNRGTKILSCEFSSISLPYLSSHSMETFRCMWLMLTYRAFYRTYETSGSRLTIRGTREEESILGEHG